DVMPRVRVLAIGLLLLLVWTFAPQPATAAEGCQTFQETGKTVCGLFLTYWREHGGLAQQGLPLTDATTSTTPDDPTPRARQYFERAIFEEHPEYAGSPYAVLLTLVGRQALHSRYLSTLPTTTPLPNNAPCATFNETGQTVCGVFLAYWQAHGGLAQQGYPLTGTFQERSVVDGQTYIVQYFERAVFEYHPANQPPYDVLLTLLGRDTCFAVAQGACFGYTAPTKPLTFSGNGSVIEHVTLPEGLLIAHGESTGTRNFIVWLKDAGATDVALLANEIAPASATRAARVPAAGAYLLDVQATGPWTLTITMPGPVEFGQAVALPHTFTGHGDGTAFITATTGALYVNGQQTGSRNFIVWVWDTTGEHVGLAANVVGSTPTATVLHVPSDGVYLLTIQADGDWTVSAHQ
ncbi:MAG: hypothetical protein ACTHMA_21645, partial [Thermomicrobiales bacterium]